MVRSTCWDNEGQGCNEGLKSKVEENMTISFMASCVSQEKRVTSSVLRHIFIFILLIILCRFYLSKRIKIVQTMTIDPLTSIDPS